MDTEKTRQTLRRRADIPNSDIEDIIGRAEVLQNEAETSASSHASLAEVEAVAEELDINPAYVEQAIEQLRGEREAQSQQLEQARRTRSRWLRRSGLTLAAFGALSLLGGGGLAFTGASQLNQQAQTVQQHQMALETAFNRQATLAPQLAALAGADPTPVLQAAQALRDAQGPAARRAASADLGAQMSVAIGQVPGSADGSANQRLLNLQYEIVGASNRIEAEAGRYDAAAAEWLRLADSLGGRVALTVGLSEAPVGLP